MVIFPHDIYRPKLDALSAALYLYSFRKQKNPKNHFFLFKNKHTMLIWGKNVKKKKKRIISLSLLSECNDHYKALIH